MAEGGENTSEVVEAVDRAFLGLNRREDRNEETAMMLASSANWQEMLSPSSMSIALLGQLLLVSADADFPLTVTPTGGFKLIKYQDSFRASLVQVANSGWEAYNEAHVNMDQIRLLSAQVPVNMSQAVKWLVGGNKREVEVMLPGELAKIERTANECLRLAQETEGKFIEVMRMTAELQEAFTGARGDYEKKLEDTRIAQRVAKEQEDELKQQRAEDERYRKETEDLVKQASVDYRKALKKVPKTSELIGLSIVDAITTGLSAMLAMSSGSYIQNTPSSGSYIQNTPSSGSYIQNTPGTSTTIPTSSAPTQHAPAASRGKDQRIVKIICLKAEQLNTCARLLQGLVSEQPNGKVDWQKIQRGSENVVYLKEQFNRVLQDLVDFDSKLSPLEDATRICQLGIELSERIERAAEKGGRICKDFQRIVEDVKRLVKEAGALSTTVRAISGMNPTESKAPQQSSMRPTSNDHGAVNGAIAASRFKVEQASAMLYHAHERYDKSCENLRDTNKRLGKVLAELAKYNMKEINFNTIRQTLMMGIEALGKVRNQWGKMVRFFEMIASIIRCCMHTSLTDFVGDTKREQSLVLCGEPLSSLMKDAIYVQVSQATRIAYTVHMISSLYVDVSNQHLMGRIESLGTLLGLDPQKDREKIRALHAKLDKECRDSLNAISDLVKEHQERFQQNVNDRAGRIQQALNAILPPPGEEEASINSEAVEEGMQNVDTEQW